MTVKDYLDECCMSDEEALDHARKLIEQYSPITPWHEDEKFMKLLEKTYDYIGPKFFE